MKLKFSITVSCAALWFASLAFAADESNIANDSPASGSVANGYPTPLEVIIVTAERRYQSLQKVPISMSVFTARDIEKSKIGSIKDVQQLVPGLTVTQASSGQALIFIRGIGTDIVGSGVEDAVPVYIDGVYQSRSSATAMQFN